MPSLSIVVPAFNEARRLPPTLRSIADYLVGGPFEPAEVLVVDDGSQDGTVECLHDAQEALAEVGMEMRVLKNEGNRGKGYSVRRGMRSARHDWILFCDADLSAPIEEVEKLLAAAAGGAEVAIGSRALDRSLIGIRQPLYRRFFGRVFNLWVRLLTGLPIADTQCGFKLFTRRAAEQVLAKQRIERGAFDVELLFLARKMRIPIAEVPVVWNHAPDSSVGLRTGSGAFVDVARVRWNDWTNRYA